MVAVIGAVIAIRAVVAACLGLTDDEAYYRLWGLSPALSYLDHPPMVGWLIASGRAVGGDTELSVRLAALAAFAVGTVALWRGGTILFGEVIAGLAGLFSLAMPLMAAGGIIITPDGPSVLSYTLTFWALAELHRSGDANWWLAVGLTAGLGLLSKYTNLFLGASILLWLVCVPSARVWFARWQLWAGGVIAVACASPVIYWNAKNDWASFEKQFGRVTDGSGITSKYWLEVIGGFVGLASPVIAVLAIVGLCHLTRRFLRERKSAEVLLFAMIAPALVYFAVHGLHSRVQANWLAPLYPFFAICAAIAVVQVAPQPRQKPLVIWGLAVGFTLCALLYLHSLMPIDNGLARKDPTDQMRGWSALADQIETMRHREGAAWIATSSYATTGQLVFALKDRAPVHQLDQRIRYQHLPVPDPAVTQRPGLYVELERRQQPALLKQRFRSVRKLDTLVRTYDGEPVARYGVYRVSEPAGSPLYD